MVGSLVAKSVGKMDAVMALRMVETKAEKWGSWAHSTAGKKAASMAALTVAYLAALKVG
jgi:hypothetical protein